MKRGLVGAGVATVVLGAALAAALVAGARGGDTGDKDGPDLRPPAAKDTVPSTDVEVPAPDALCVAHDELVTTLAPVGTVESPAGLETLVLAQLAFHTTAAGSEPEPEASAFRSMAGYWDAVRNFYSARGWDQQVDISEAGQLPRPPVDGSATRTNEILAERCGVSLPADTPT